MTKLFPGEPACPTSGRSAQRRVSVERPVAPCGAREPILVEHADDGHHGQPAVGDLGVELPTLGVTHGHRAAVGDAKDTCVRVVTWSTHGVVREEDLLDRAAEEEDLHPT